METDAAVAAKPHAYEYVTVRGPLPRSTLVGVRGNFGGATWHFARGGADNMELTP